MSAQNSVAWGPWQWSSEYSAYYISGVNEQGTVVYHWHQPALAQQQTSMAQYASINTGYHGQQLRAQQSYYQTTYTPYDGLYNSNASSYGSSGNTSSSPRTQPSASNTAYQSGYASQNQQASVAYQQSSGPSLQVASPIETLPATYNTQQVHTQPSSSIFMEAQTTSSTMPAVSENTGDAQFRQRLNEKYQKITDRKKMKKFWQPGKVFATLWTEPAGSSSRPNTEFSTIKFGEHAYAQIRRFIVLKASRDYSQCLAIHTYGGKGAVGREDIQNHSILYNVDEEAPEPRPGESFDKHPVAMIIEDTDFKIAPTARINYSKAYTVEHNVKVRKLGRISDPYLEWVKYYYNEATRA